MNLTDLINNFNSGILTEEDITRFEYEWMKDEWSKWSGKTSIKTIRSPRNNINIDDDISDSAKTTRTHYNTRRKRGSCYGRKDK